MYASVCVCGSVYMNSAPQCKQSGIISLFSAVCIAPADVDTIATICFNKSCFIVFALNVRRDILVAVKIGFLFKAFIGLN